MEVLKIDINLFGNRLSFDYPKFLNNFFSQV